VSQDAKKILGMNENGELKKVFEKFEVCFLQRGQMLAFA
jgi:hypothetical protein